MGALIILALAQAATVPPAPLAVFKPLLGACWRTEFSPTVHDTHCFEPMYGDAHVRDRHEVQDGGKTVYAGETVYSAIGTAITFNYFNSLGGSGEGIAKVEDGRVNFTGAMRASPNDQTKPIDSHWRFIDADRYEVRATGPGGPNKPLVFTRVN